jgi:hypothetical protein
MRLTTLAAALMLVAASPALAQNGSGGNGDSPQNKGSTGWTGAHPEVGGATQDRATPGKPTTTGQKVQVHDDALAKDQPAMASGEDLKGPTQHFAPSKTPE